MTYRAWIPARGESADDGFDVPREPSNACFAAEAAADMHHACHDGWEQDWPIVFAIRDEAGRVYYFAVEREMVPEFSARPIVEGPKQVRRTVEVMP